MPVLQPLLNRLLGKEPEPTRTKYSTPGRLSTRGFEEGTIAGGRRRKSLVCSLLRIFCRCPRPLWSKTEVSGRNREVRFTAESRLNSDIAAFIDWASHQDCLWAPCNVSADIAKRQLFVRVCPAANCTLGTAVCLGSADEVSRCYVIDRLEAFGSKLLLKPGSNGLSRGVAAGVARPLPCSFIQRKRSCTCG
jgi:hypothetical protein